MIELQHELVPLHLTTPLTVSYESSTAATNVIVRISADGKTGLGEASPHLRSGETVEGIVAVLERYRAALGDDPFQFTEIMERLDAIVPNGGAARAGVDLALYDLLGGLLGVPLYRLLGLDPRKTTWLTYTIGLDTPRAMVEHALKAARSFKYLKVKLGIDSDAEAVRLIAREVPHAIIRGDVNGGWEARHAIRMVNDVLQPAGVEFIEQPLDPRDRNGLRLLHSQSALPIVLDESIGRVEDILMHRDLTDGVNIKLMKCGGISAALRMIHVARALNLKVMLGCRIETSLGIAAAAHLTPLADFADLDLHLLLKHDPFIGATLSPEGRFILPNGPGLGVIPRDGNPA